MIFLCPWICFMGIGLILFIWCVVCFILGKRVDISIYQKQSNGTYKELHRPTGGPWGGTNVDEAFDQLIIKIVGAICFQKFKYDFKEDYLEFHRELEFKKRSTKPESNKKVTIQIPGSLVTTFENETGENMREVIQGMHYSSKLSWQGQKLRMGADLFKQLFRKPVNMLVEHLQQLMAEDNLSDVSTLLMVGGFLESPVMQDAILNAFSDKRVLVPEEAGLAVLKGAVILGHEPCAVLESNPPGLLWELIILQQENYKLSALILSKLFLRSSFFVILLIDWIALRKISISAAMPNILLPLYT